MKNKYFQVHTHLLKLECHKALCAKSHLRKFYDNRFDWLTGCKLRYFRANFQMLFNIYQDSWNLSVKQTSVITTWYENNFSLVKQIKKADCLWMKLDNSF